MDCVHWIQDIDSLPEVSDVLFDVFLSVGALIEWLHEMWYI